jgi:hypothetical protein
MPAPFRPPWERPAQAPPERLVERYRVGPWTLRAAPERAAPRDFVLRCDRPGFPKGQGVTLDLHDGWTMRDGGERFVSREGPLACLEWWASRHK